MALDKSDIRNIKEIVEESSAKLEKRLIGRMDNKFEQFEGKVDAKFEQFEERILVKTEMMIENQTDYLERQIDDVLKIAQETLVMCGGKIDNHEERITRVEEEVGLKSA